MYNSFIAKTHFIHLSKKKKKLPLVNFRIMGEKIFKF